MLVIHKIKKLNVVRNIRGFRYPELVKCIYSLMFTTGFQHFFLQFHRISQNLFLVVLSPNYQKQNIWYSKRISIRINSTKYSNKTNRIRILKRIRIFSITFDYIRIYSYSYSLKIFKIRIRIRIRFNFWEIFVFVFV